MLIDFIFQFSSIANLSKETPEAALILFDFYLSHEKEFKHDIQLIAMTCILICSKMFDVNPLSLNTLHRISTHVYNNAMVLNCETYLLRLINFDVFVRDNLLSDRVGLYLENVRCFFEKEDFNVFVDLCFKISALIHEEMKLRKDDLLSKVHKLLATGKYTEKEDIYQMVFNKDDMSILNISDIKSKNDFYRTKSGNKMNHSKSQCNLYNDNSLFITHEQEYLDKKYITKPQTPFHSVNQSYISNKK